MLRLKCALPSQAACKDYDKVLLGNGMYPEMSSWGRRKKVKEHLAKQAKEHLARQVSSMCSRRAWCLYIEVQVVYHVVAYAST